MEWHKNYIHWFQKKLKLSNYAVLWIAFFKGLLIGGLLVYYFTLVKK